MRIGMNRRTARRRWLPSAIAEVVEAKRTRVGLGMLVVAGTWAACALPSAALAAGSGDLEIHDQRDTIQWLTYQQPNGDVVYGGQRLGAAPGGSGAGWTSASFDSWQRAGG
jgi:hypothetical protein